MNEFKQMANSAFKTTSSFFESLVKKVEQFGETASNKIEKTIQSFASEMDSPEGETPQSPERISPDRESRVSDFRKYDHLSPGLMEPDQEAIDLAIAMSLSMQQPTESEETNEEKEQVDQATKESLLDLHSVEKQEDVPSTSKSE